jgi:aldose 1-epimerase
MTLLSLRTGPLAVDLAPSAGGSIARFCIDDIDLLRPMTVADQESGLGNNAAAYPLFPFSGRIANGRLLFEGEAYQLARNREGVNHPLHGDGWHNPWRVERRDEHSAEIVYEHERADSKAGKKGSWPFRYRARQSYRLDADRLTVTMALDNLEDRTVPAGLGLHPFFARDEDNELQCRLQHVWRTDAEVLPIERTSVPPEWDFSTSRRVMGTGLDNCFGGWDGHATITWPGRRLRLDLEASESFRHLVIFTPPDRPFFCVEPVSHANGEVVLAPLAPGATRTGTVVFRITRN